MTAPTQGEREARWPERCPVCSHDFGRDAVVFDLATHVAVRHADEMKAWLAALSTQEEAGAPVLERVEFDHEAKEVRVTPVERLAPQEEAGAECDACKKPIGDEPALTDGDRHIHERCGPANAEYDYMSERLAPLVAGPMSEESKRLADAALARMEARKDEDVGAWAERLGSDIAATPSDAAFASPTDAPPHAIRPARVWADGTVREWWVDDGDGAKIVVAHQELAPQVAQPGECIHGVRHGLDCSSCDLGLLRATPPVAGSRDTEVEVALRACRKELRSWLAWANDGTALRMVRPMREKGEDAVRLADIALESLRAPAPGTGDAPTVDGVPLIRWVSERLDVVGERSEEDPLAGLLVWASQVASGITSHPPGFAAFIVEQATRALLRAPGTGGVVIVHGPDDTLWAKCDRCGVQSEPVRP